MRARPHRSEGANCRVCPTRHGQRCALCLTVSIRSQDESQDADAAVCSSCSKRPLQLIDMFINIERKCCGPPNVSTPAHRSSSAVGARAVVVSCAAHFALGRRSSVHQITDGVGFARPTD
eukprot:1368014-Prymnesium_polylepis.2